MNVILYAVIYAMVILSAAMGFAWTEAKKTVKPPISAMIIVFVMRTSLIAGSYAVFLFAINRGA